MKTGTLVLLAIACAASALPARAQDPWRVPDDWLRLEPRQNLAPNNWRDAAGFAPAARVRWSYPIGPYHLGMSLATGRDYEAAPIFGSEMRQYGLFGRYWLSPDWSVNAETVSRDPGTVFRLQDFRIGLQRHF